MTPEEKEKNLLGQIAPLKSVLIAFSGGTDSAYLTYITAGIDSLQTLAVTIQTPYMHQHEMYDAQSF
jgi:PP-loop superfamily ATP-utilizing enzyme